MARFDNKVAIVSGGSSGISRAIALHLASEGAKVAVCSIDSDEALASIVADIAAAGSEGFAAWVDVSDRDEVFSFVQQTAEKLGGVDILVNGAAYMMAPEPFEELSAEKYHRSISVGLDSVFHFLQAVFPHMKDNGGKVIAFTSMGGVRGVPGLSSYNAAKAGLIGLVRSAANEWAKHRININLIAPIAMSPAWEGLVAAQPEGTNPFDALGTRHNAVDYPGDPLRDIAPAAAFLCSSDADYITGQILNVDGGLMDLE